MSGINKILLVGHMGRPPETRYTQSGTAVTNFSLATSESWKDKQTGEKKEDTEWHSCVCWNRLAEIVGEYGDKGKLVAVEGRLKTRSWDQDGVTKYKTEIVASTVQFLGGQRRERPADSGYPEPPAANDPDDGIPF